MNQNSEEAPPEKERSYHALLQHTGHQYGSKIHQERETKSDYIFRKRKSGRSGIGAGSAVEKYNLRVKARIKEKPKESHAEQDIYDRIDEYSPDRLKTIRNTRALTKKLNKLY